MNKYRNDAIYWARDILQNKDQYVIFDTETTGLQNDDLTIHIGIMDLNGDMLMDTPVKPLSKRKMNPEAKYLHGYSIKDLEKAPLLVDVLPKIQDIAETKTFLSYNADFHLGMLEQSIKNEGIIIDLKINGRDVKVHYIDFTGLYNPPLPNRNNTGVGDCKATLDLIRIMAFANTEEAGRVEKRQPAKQVSQKTKPTGCGIIIFAFAFMLVLTYFFN
jgi:hypothetical protein